MKTTTQLAALLLLATLNAQLSTGFAQGSLTPPGVPAPTMKSLAQIEPRTPISAAPFTISVPGSYYLTTNLTVASGTAITIATNGVTLDLNGFTIASTAPVALGSSYGIYINSGLRNLAILNGFIQGGVTNNGSGVFSGSGFGYGLYCAGAQNTRVSGVSVAGCLYHGLNLGFGDATVVESCTVRTVGSSGIIASTVKASVAVDCGGTAIAGDQVTDCRGESTGSSTGLSAGNAQNCYGSSTSGTGLSAPTAQNCYGTSGGSGHGLFATLAQNCYGSSTNGNGVNGSIAQNCYGVSSSGYGLSAARSAIGCYGTSTTGDGLYAAYNANTCFGSSISGTGLYAGNASFCTGYRAGGTAIQAIVATGCRAASGTNDITYKYNMP